MTERYHHGDLRNALLDAAIAWLDERGELPSLRQLAAACGVSHGAPYRHFADATALNTAIATRSFGDLNAAIRAATASGDAAAHLEAGTRAYVAWGLAHPARYRLMFGDALASHGADPAFLAAATGAFDLLVEAFAALGVPSPRHAAGAAWAAQHGVVDLLHKGLRPPDGEPRREQTLVDDLVRMLRCWADGQG